MIFSIESRYLYKHEGHIAFQPPWSSMRAVSLISLLIMWIKGYYYLERVNILSATKILRVHDMLSDYI